MKKYILGFVTAYEITIEAENDDEALAYANQVQEEMSRKSGMRVRSDYHNTGEVTFFRDENVTVSLADDDAMTEEDY